MSMPSKKEMVLSAHNEINKLLRLKLYNVNVYICQLPIKPPWGIRKPSCDRNEDPAKASISWKAAPVVAAHLIHTPMRDIGRLLDQKWNMC